VQNGGDGGGWHSAALCLHAPSSNTRVAPPTLTVDLHLNREMSEELKDHDTIHFSAIGLNGPRTANKPRSSVALVWAVARLPMIVALVYLFRARVLDVIERQFDILTITQFVIDLLSVPVTRIIVGIGFFAVLLAAAAGTGRLRPVLAYVTTLLVACCALAGLVMTTATSLRRGLIIVLILALNLAPAGLFERVRGRPRTWNLMMLTGIGVVELFFAREYWDWIRGARRSRDSVGSGLPSTIPALLLASLAAAVLIRDERLVAFEQKIRLSPDVKVIERGLSMNWIELDPSGTYLYATGHDVPSLRRFDLRNLAAPPLVSDIPTGGAQGFAYDPLGNELFAVNTYSRQLLYLDATTLKLRKTADLAQLSPGDPWIAVDAQTDTLTVVSEADVRIGDPLIVVERSSGRTVARADLDAGNLLKHPSRPWLYLTFFRRRSEVMLYDLEARSVTRRAPADPRAERMAFWKTENELLVTSPIESRVLRFDADTLTPKGYFAALFGVRAIALDEARQLLLCGNIATGHLIVLDLRTGARVSTRYLGPWLRTIELDVPNGTAYVSANGALYVLRYSAALARSAPSRAP
jgi:DNA-binding beta-propeller fold protein YncE